MSIQIPKHIFEEMLALVFSELFGKYCSKAHGYRDMREDPEFKRDITQLFQGELVNEFLETRNDAIAFYKELWDAADPVAPAIGVRYVQENLRAPAGKCYKWEYAPTDSAKGLLKSALLFGTDKGNVIFVMSGAANFPEFDHIHNLNPGDIVASTARLGRREMMFLLNVMNRDMVEQPTEVIDAADVVVPEVEDTVPTVDSVDTLDTPEKLLASENFGLENQTRVQLKEAVLAVWEDLFQDGTLTVGEFSDRSNDAIRIAVGPLLPHTQVHVTTFLVNMVDGDHEHTWKVNIVISNLAGTQVGQFSMIYERPEAEAVPVVVTPAKPDTYVRGLRVELRDLGHKLWHSSEVQQMSMHDRLEYLRMNLTQAARARTAPMSTYNTDVYMSPTLAGQQQWVYKLEVVNNGGQLDTYLMGGLEAADGVDHAVLSGMIYRSWLEALDAGLSPADPAFYTESDTAAKALFGRLYPGVRVKITSIQFDDQGAPAVYAYVELPKLMHNHFVTGLMNLITQELVADWDNTNVKLVHGLK
jgi:hypothetical protein